MKRTMLLSMTAVLCLVALGCKTKPKEGAYVPASVPNSPEARGSEIVLLNADLKRTLAVDQPVTLGRTDNGSLRLQAGLRNRTDDEVLHVQVQTLWFDEGGRVLFSQPGSETAWQTLTISPNQTIYYMANALSPDATRFTVRVRYTKGAK